MAENLKILSDAATQGTWSLGTKQGGYQYVDAAGIPERQGQDQNIKWSGFARFVVEMEDGLSCAGEANVALALALVNDYRAGRFHDDAALAEAEARGMRAGIERAAALLEERATYFRCAPSHRTWGDAGRSYRSSAKEVRALATAAPAETEEQA